MSGTDWLRLAATPTFAGMALLNMADGAGPMLSSDGPASPLSGMALMYLLMGVFHAAPWLRLVAGRFDGHAPAGKNGPIQLARTSNA